MPNSVCSFCFSNFKFLCVSVESVLKQHHAEIPFSDGDFVETCTVTTKKPGKKLNKQSGEKAEKREANEEAGPESSSQEGSLFSCPNQGCVSMFQFHHNLEFHLLYGKCKLETERLNLLDKAKLLYAERLQDGSGKQASVAGPVVPRQDAEVMPMGWALKTTKKSSRFNENQKNYLDEKFKIGQQTGNKANPVHVSQDMRHAKNEVGLRRFTLNEFLSSQQIQSYFSRKAAKLKTETGHDNAVEDQISNSTIRSVAVQECQLVHPIIYDTYNICEMYATHKLKKLNIAMLRLICIHFDLDIGSISGRRKLPYIELIGHLVSECSCSGPVIRSEAPSLGDL